MAGAMYCITADAKETGNEGGGNGDGGTITAAHIPAENSQQSNKGIKENVTKEKRNKVTKE